MPDLTDALDGITELVESARSLPKSASCVLNRAELLGQLAALRDQLPQAVVDARAVVEDRDGVVAEGTAEAERLLAAAREEREALVRGSSVLAAATERAEAVLAEARASAEQLRREVDDYVDGKLATFEVVLQKTLVTVDRGREKLRGRHDLDDLAGVDPDAVSV